MSDASLILRPATADDAALVYHIKHEAYADHVIRVRGSWDETFQRGYTARNLPDTKIVVEGGTPVGFVAVREGDGVRDILDLHIRPAHQRRGVGTWVLGEVLRAADAAADRVILEVLKGNPSRALYERLGFVAAGESATHTRLERPANKRAFARGLAQASLAAGQPLAWFEQLYARSRAEENVVIPWADGVPNPNVVALYEKIRHLPLGRSALVVGCGLGDDAEWLAALGVNVTAFDIAPSAIARCRCRFPQSDVHYVAADLFAPPAEWRRAFDVVLEAYTIQAMPVDLRAEATARIADFVAPGGHLWLVTHGRSPSDPPGNLPWPLTEAEVDAFAGHGLRRVFFEDRFDEETPPTRRFLACFAR